MVFAIERASMHDGPGLRTTVFLKGCPLHCLWCHNPESHCPSPVLYFLNDKCVLCGKCTTVCSNNCHSLTRDKHYIERDACVTCGACVSACPSSALEIKGVTMSVDEVLEEVEKDKEYYIASGGGMTLSGGEPMMQFEFSAELLAKAKKLGIHTCIETSGFAPTENFLKIRKHVDLFLFDYKESDPVHHKKYTGVDNQLILENLFQLDSLGAKIILRCPIIPDINDREDHFREIANIANKLKNIVEINVMVYHPMGQSKSTKIGEKYSLKDIGFPETETTNKWIEAIKHNSKVLVKKG